MSPPGERVALRIRGRVQGVGYRIFAARLARSLGLAGGVRNDADGTVVIVVAGGDAAGLAELRRGLERGPAAARVAGVETIAPDGAPMDLEF